MRLKGEITINYSKPVTKELVCVSFDFEGKTYYWNTSTWKRGNPIAYGVKGEKYNVSFRVVGEYNVKNLIQLKK
jgi:UDP-N-acetylmuramyl tripeptide synthase